jgi:subtilase family serine protease
MMMTTLLAIEVSSLTPDPYIAILQQTLATDNDSSSLCIVLFLSDELRRTLNSPAKRAGRGHFKQLQQFISGLYVASAAKVDVSCDVVFADWCGYSLEEEVWEYTTLTLPECMSPKLVLSLVVGYKS